MHGAALVHVGTHTQSSRRSRSVSMPPTVTCRANLNQAATNVLCTVQQNRAPSPACIKYESNEPATPAPREACDSESQSVSHSQRGV